MRRRRPRGSPWSVDLVSPPVRVHADEVTDAQENVTFDLIGERYEKMFVERTEQRRAGEWLLERLPERARVLDVGCGTGVPTALQFTGAGVEVVGIDESERMLELARRRVPQARFLLRDMRELGTDLGEFDAVTAFFSLLMVSRADIAEVLREIRQRLRGPRLLALSMVYGDFDEFPMTFMGAPMRVSAYPTEQLSAVVRSAGFRIEREWEAFAEAEPGRMERQDFLCAVAETADA
jgi:SAM-dependent methyltransferase